MNRLPVLLVVGLGLSAGATLAVRAQAPAPTAPAPPAAGQTPAAQGGRGGAGGGAGRGGGGGGGAATATVNPSDTTNERSNVQIDQFIGSPVNSTGHLSHGGLFTRSMLRSGNPNVPGPPGAVLEYRTQIATATLGPNNATALMSINSQFLFYVVSGQGRLDDGKNYWDLKEGVGVLIPQNVQRRFTNASSEDLQMIMVEWPANSLARKDILVRDSNLLPYCEENAHWNNISKCMFAQTDGMTGRVLLVMLMPFTMAAPHTHTPGTEEIWTKLTPGNGIMLLGSELRDMPQFTSFLAPPNGITWHAQINTSKTQTEKWLYVAAGSNPPAAAAAPAGPAAAPAPAAGRGGPANPNLLFRDQAAVDQGTVKPTPLR